MSILFVLAVALLAFVMKMAALFVGNPGKGTRWLFILSPPPSPISFRRSAAVVPVQLVRALLFATALVLYHWIYWLIVRRFDLQGVALSYLGVPALWLLGEVVSALVPVLWLGRVPPPFHDPLLADSLSDFWGRRWNLWFSDWFRHVIFQPLRRKPILALIFVFFISGLMHEWAVNVPYFLLAGKSLFGSMMLYFLLQAIGILIGRRFPALDGRVLCWLCVIGPAPLILNEGLLRALHLWPSR